MLLKLKKQSKQQPRKHFIERSSAMSGFYLFDHIKYKAEVESWKYKLLLRVTQMEFKFVRLFKK